MAVGVAGLWGVSALLCVLVWLGVRDRARLVRVGAGVVIFCLTVELGLRAIAPADQPSYLVWEPSRRTTFEPAPDVMPGVTYEVSRFTTSRDGLRGRDRRSTDHLRILAVGGSTTEELYLDDVDAWPEILEQRLNSTIAAPTWVGNAGRSGLDLGDHVVLLRTLGAELRPDVTLVLVGANELTRRGSAIDWDRGMLQFERVTRGPVIVDGRARWSGLATFWQVLSIGRRVKHPGWTGGVLVLEDARTFYTRARQMRESGELVDQLPSDLAEGVSAYGARLHLLADAAEGIGTRLVLLTQPSLYRSTMTIDDERLLWSGLIDPDAERYYSSRVMTELLAAFNAETLRVCAERHLECLDLARLVPPSTDAFYDDFHFNLAGSRLVAQRVADFLADRPWIGH